MWSPGVTPWPAFAARLVLGGVFVVAGVLKLPDPVAAVRAVRAHRLLPEVLVGVALGLPVVEVAVGLALFAGVFVRTAALASAVLLVAFLVGVSAAWARGLRIDCGCCCCCCCCSDRRGSALGHRGRDVADRLRRRRGHRPGDGGPLRGPPVPDCRASEAATGPTLHDLVTANTVRVVHHGMAFLDTSANDDCSTRALDAAAVVASTAGAGAFQTLHGLLDADQPEEGGSGLTDDQLIADATRAGTTGMAVESGIRDLVHGDWTATVTEQASRDGVTGTPTVLVAGVELTELSADGLTEAVTAAQQG